MVSSKTRIGPQSVSPLDVTDSNGSVHFDPGLFDELIASKGISFSHQIAIPCAGSDANTENIRSSHYDHDCDMGYFYKDAPCTFTGVFTNNPSSKFFKPEGMIDSSTSWIICPRTYDNSDKQIFFSAYDRVYIEHPEFKKIVVPTFERMEMSQTGVEQTRFPIIHVQYLMDYTGKEYKDGIDFIIDDGCVRWISQNRPLWNPTLNVGSPYSIRYLYRPYWYIVNVDHEIRISNAVDPDTGENTQVRLPQYLRCMREIFFHDKEQNPTIDKGAREGYAPPSGANLGSFR